MLTPAGLAREQILERVRALAPGFAARAAAGEEARRLPPESAREMLDAGLARILMPPRFGGYGLDFDTWLDVVLEISKADASHGWCAALMTHHAHMVAQFPEAAQRAIWAGGPDVSVAASVAPRVTVTRAPGGFRISGDNASFASGVDHSAWVMVGGLAPGEGAPEWSFFLLPPGAFSVRDTWFTAGMKGTGSKTIVIDDAFVPSTHVLRQADLRLGQGPGGAVHDLPLFRTPFYFYAPITFATPMLGAAIGAYRRFRDWTRTRRSVDGSAVAEKLSVQVAMARAAADLDAAELLLRRAAQAHRGPQAEWPQLLARAVRDYTRASELATMAIDALMALSGSGGFASAEPIQRAWRDIHFAATHISLNLEFNYGHFGRMEFGLPRDPARPFL